MTCELHVCKLIEEKLSAYKVSEYVEEVDKVVQHWRRLAFASFVRFQE